MLAKCLPPSNGPPITRVPPRRLTLPNNLHDLPPPQPQILGHRIPRLNPRQLTFLQPIPLQQLFFLRRAHQDMFRHQLMMRNIDQQIRLLERLDPLILEPNGRFERRSGHRTLCD